MEDPEQSLRDKLLRFATSERYDRELARAFDLYWDGKYQLDDTTELSEIDHARFVEFYIYDHMLAEYNCTPVDLFDEFRGYTLSDDERRILDEWHDTLFGVFSVGPSGPEGTVLRDIFDGTEVTVVNPELAELPRECLLIGRVISVLGKKRLSGAVSTVSISTEPVLREFVTAQYDFYRREKPGVTWREFLRSSRHRLQHLLLDMRRKATTAEQTERSI